MVHIRPDDPRLDSPDPKIWGPLVWEELDEFTDAYLHCKSCHESFKNWTQAYRDSIAIENGRLPHNPQNLLEVFQRLGHFVEECHKAGHCSPRRTGIRATACERKYPEVLSKLERCVLAVKEKGTARNPYAVCRASVKCPPK